nr:unnamed protein product [Callosobruchus chinensis]
MTIYSKKNRGYKFILVIINRFSKYVWCAPLKNKFGPVVAKAMEQVFQQSKQTPRNLQTDADLEFFNKYFDSLMKKYSMNHYNVFSEKKAAIIERVHLTLKNIM